MINKIIGLHFFEETLTSDRYLHFLTVVLPGVLENVMYQHAGAPAHSKRDVSAHMNRIYHMWIGNKASKEKGHIV